MSLDMPVNSPTLLCGSTNLGGRGRLANHKLATGEATLGSTGDRVCGIRGAIKRLLTHINRETINHDSLGPASRNLDVDSGLGAVLRNMARVSLNVSLIDIRIPLGEVLAVTSHKRHIFGDVYETLIESASIVAGGHADHVTVSGLVKGLLDILVRSLRRPSVILV